MLEVLDAATPGTLAFRHTGVFDRSRLTVSYLVHSIEHESRLAKSLGALTDEFLLAGLMTLPTEDLAPVDSRFTDAFRPRRTSLAAMVVSDPGGGLWGRCLVRPPVEVFEIETQSIDVAHRWVGYGPRVARTSRSVEPIALTEAAHYGIGVTSPEGRLLEPDDYRPLRWTSARWRFAELVYGQFRELAD
jgi:hypothetical protein